MGLYYKLYLLNFTYLRVNGYEGTVSGVSVERGRLFSESDFEGLSGFWSSVVVVVVVVVLSGFFFGGF